MFWNIRIVALLIYVCTFIGACLGFRELAREDANRKFIWYIIACFILMNFALFMWLIG